MPEETETYYLVAMAQVMVAHEPPHRLDDPGGGGGGAGTLSTNQAGGGGGGSSLLAKALTYNGLSTNITSKLVGTNPSSSGGAIVITYLGKTLP